ncbi:uncharacterized protein LOC124444739 isoform X2 [Xenia sp. Carnegie-2017]|nr:uncharacterized protein LOC124444739 isoform X2 [Xenia sp. Carnegie-2017]XP_046851338.1 uncharacterized protein LOC124444739 isoform X2 [Xenia sp. Carnegie-2017]XP_046851339.1 uncharacterized protein LOC124444739 isoform X2 [Xenia sp. Carnegie-2017]
MNSASPLSKIKDKIASSKRIYTPSFPLKKNMLKLEVKTRVDTLNFVHYSINNTKKKFKGRNANVKEAAKKQRYQTLYCMSEEEFFRTAKELLKLKNLVGVKNAKMRKMSKDEKDAMKNNEKKEQRRQSYGFDETKVMDATRPPKKNAYTAKISSSSNLSVDGILHLFELSGNDHVHS